MDIDAFQQQLGIQFADASLLQQALTHRSYVNEHDDKTLVDNERLEFLGDAVLGFLIGEMLYRRFPNFAEGDLTRLRAALVRNETLAILAKSCHIGEALRMGRGEDASGGRERLTNLGSGFEALLGALYLDQGLESVRSFIQIYLLPMLDEIIAGALDRDARSQIQEWSQAKHSITPVYSTVSETGPDHQKEFTVVVLIHDQVYGIGTGRSKQAAAQSAARAALRTIRGEAVSG